MISKIYNEIISKPYLNTEGDFIMPRPTKLGNKLENLGIQIAPDASKKNFEEAKKKLKDKIEKGIYRPHTIKSDSIRQQ